MAKKTKTTNKKRFLHPLLRTAILAGCIIVLVVSITNVMLNLFTRHNDYYNVPDFSGMTLPEAKRAAKEGKLVLELSDSLYVPSLSGGVILEQRPLMGAKVKSGRRVFLTINSFRERLVEVPYVAGYSLRQAKNNLELSGLRIKELIYKEDIATNNVLEQFYDDTQILQDSKLEVAQSSAITLVVGKAQDAPLQNVPKLVGLSLSDAQSRLWELGLNVEDKGSDKDVNGLNKYEAKVFAQSVLYSEQVDLGSKIMLKLTFNQDKVTRGVRSADSTYKVKLKEAELLQKMQDSITQAKLDSATLSTISSEQEIMKELMNFNN
ncbi:MAG: PASTA domain-containing protein [Rikenellaceae bacterium]